MSDDERYRGQQLFQGVQDGIVVQNINDGSKQYIPGLIRVRIPTIAEPDSSWATPFGGAAGGGVDKGMFIVPDVGSTVACFFVEGDPDELYYAPAGWSFANLPTAVKNAFDEDGAEGAVMIEVWSNSRFELVFDKRENKARLFMRSKRHPDQPEEGEMSFKIEMDDETGLLEFSAPSGIVFRTLGKIVMEASSVEISERSVNPMGDTI